VAKGFWMTVLEFEKKYKDKLENIKEWNYLRIHVGFYLKNKKNKSSGDKNQKLNFFGRVKSKWFLLSNSFFGFRNWFRRYDYIFVSDSGERKLIDGYYFDKFFDDLINRIGRDKSLLIEMPIESHRTNSYTKYIVSINLAKVLSKLIPFVFLKSTDQINEISKVLNEPNIYFSENIIKFYKEYTIYKLILRMHAPQKVFINCSYCNLPFVKAAKDLGIKVIEVQHGVISKEHFGYISYVKLDKTFIPDEIFVWQKMDYKHFIVPKQLVLGHFYLDYLSNLRIKKYDGINIAVTMQDQDWEFFALVDFLKNVADNYSEISFYLIPRRRRDFADLPKNVKVANEDCYFTLLKCQYHMSIYSSCVIEAGYFNIPSILLDINGYASKYFGKYEEKFVFIIKNQVDFGDLLEKDLKINKFNAIDKNYLDNIQFIINGHNKEINDK
jgi:hypothetical protein